MKFPTAGLTEAEGPALCERAVDVVIAVHHFPPSHMAGAELRAYRLARWLQQNGHRARVICVERVDDPAAGAGLVSTTGLYDDIPVERLSINLSATPDPIRWSYDHPLIADHLRRRLEADPPDAVHLFSGYLLGIAPLTAARQLGIFTVVTLTDFWFLCPTIQLVRGDGSLCSGPEPLECARCLYDSRRRYRLPDSYAPGAVRAFLRTASKHPSLGHRLGLIDRLEALDDRRHRLREALEGAEAIVTLTRALAARHASNGIDTSRVVFVPQTISAGDLPAQSERTPPSNGDLRFGYLGQLAAVKGVDVLIHAFKRLDVSKKGARLTIHGGAGAVASYARHLHRLAAGESSISIRGPYERSQLRGILSSLDVVVVPSIWYENWPAVITEAFSAGRPVIGTNVDGIAEVVKHDCNGLLFERASVHGLAEQMQRLLDEPALLDRLRAGISPVSPEGAEMEAQLQLYRQAARTRDLRANLRLSRVESPLEPLRGPR